MKIIDNSGGYGGYLSHVEIDTAHFKGNFPESCELHAIDSPDLIPPHQQWVAGISEESSWATILPRTGLGPHRRHFFQLQNVGNVKYTHVMLTIHPDGGVKRVRVIGTQRVGATHETRSLAPSEEGMPTAGAAEGESRCGDVGVRLGRSYAFPKDRSAVLDGGKVKALRALPLTPEGFAAFGQVVQGYRDLNAVPRSVRVTVANQGSAYKFHKVSLLESSYPEDVQVTSGLSVYRCQPIDAKSGGHWDIKVLERHLHTNQAFIPMGPGSTNEGDQGLKETARAYLVVAAQNGKDDKPDLETMRAFIATSAQGIVYNTGIWRKSHRTPFTTNKAKLEDQITPWRCWRRFDLAGSSHETFLLTVP
jgi:allantoicase